MERKAAAIALARRLGWALMPKRMTETGERLFALVSTDFAAIEVEDSALLRLGQVEEFLATELAWFSEDSNGDLFADGA